MKDRENGEVLFDSPQRAVAPTVEEEEEVAKVSDLKVIGN